MCIIVEKDEYDIGIWTEIDKWLIESLNSSFFRLDMMIW
jgi:hypothetical protein